MTRKRAIYTPPPIPAWMKLFGFAEPEPTEVDLIEYKTEPDGTRVALVLVPTSSDSLLAVLSGRDGEKNLPGFPRLVPAEQVEEIVAEA